MQVYGCDQNDVNKQPNAITKGMAGSVRQLGPNPSLYTYNKINS